MDLQRGLFSFRGRIPTFQQTLAALGDTPSFLYHALEFGTERNRTFFKTMSEDEPPRAHIRETIVRDQGKRFLERNSFQVEDETISVGNEPLSALLVRCGLIQIRVLKGPGGIVPGCGDSLRRSKFYNQSRDLYLDKSGKTRETKMNLLCLWNFDNSFNLDRLWLVYPMRSGQSSTEILWHWHEELEHPLVTMAKREDERTDAEKEAQRQQAEDELEKLLRNEIEENLEDEDQQDVG